MNENVRRQTKLKYEDLIDHRARNFKSESYGGPQLSHQIKIAHIKLKSLTSN